VFGADAIVEFPPNDSPMRCERCHNSTNIRITAGDVCDGNAPHGLWLVQCYSCGFSQCLELTYGNDDSLHFQGKWWDLDETDYQNDGSYSHEK
jgi:hypothetical protein